MIYILKLIHYFWFVFSKTSEKCLEIYHLDFVKFLSAPGLAWQANFKKTEVNLELLTDIDMLLMSEKGIRGMQFVDLQKLIINI